MSDYDKRESANDDSTITTIYPKDSSYLSFFLYIVPVFGFIGLLPILVIISGPGIRMRERCIYAIPVSRCTFDSNICLQDFILYKSSIP